MVLDTALYTLYFPCELRPIDYLRRIMDLSASALWRVLPSQDDVRLWARNETGRPVDAHCLLEWIVDKKQEICPARGNLRHVVSALAPDAAPAAQEELANGLRAALELHNSSFSRRVFDDRMQMNEARLIEHSNATARLFEIIANGGNRAHGAFAKCIVNNVLELQKLAISHRRSQRARVEELIARGLGSGHLGEGDDDGDADASGEQLDLPSAAELLANPLLLEERTRLGLNAVSAAASDSEAIVAAMQAFLDIALVVREGCRVLRSTALTDAGRQAAVNAKAARAIVGALNLHTNSSSVVAEACGALQNMTLFGMGGQAAVDARAPVAVV